METVSSDFRNAPSYIGEGGKRNWVFPKKPSGPLHNWRVLATIVLLGILFAGPFIKIGGQPFLLLNIFDRKFIIFGQVFWPQDTHLLIFLLLIFFVFIILFTVAFGRVWCGWACPQTLFMEMVFRKIEYWIEGDYTSQRKLSQAPWSTEKLFKRTIKYGVFLLISLAISHTVMAYLMGIDETLAIVSQSPAEHMAGFIGLMVFTGIFFFVFAFLRDQACTVICPYGRLQGVLLDKNSIVVIYDWLRGEPRGKIKKAEVQESKGDCIDCKLCVHVCPTGIDIRNGTQMECVNCTACIDACDDVMVKINKPKGLIRFDSHAGIEEKKPFRITPRLAAYSLVLVLLLAAFAALLITRTDFEATITKVRGTTFQQQPDGSVSNLYNIQLVNKTFSDIPVRLSIGQSKAEIVLVGGDKILLPQQEKIEQTFFIKLPAEEITQHRQDLAIEVYAGEELIETIETSFVAPVKRKNAN
ncbi:cytochrome c oxidase accessory protein CcoG [Cytophagales bacterium LB-30]|uniref:Cytochrome c oxidase accessory protein CcoG n=1 Tax=Shiella aurantiaca TaxID=3058365 RepID=A0ABT8F2S8_9BACT|nr:cytochrome c oxidase accessory protein CcoG [Shiella aurantiaca]MDN4164579.1 cytochrome c oxidase accessory protein CcoG [Shiella aurantiaca]